MTYYDKVSNMPLSPRIYAILNNTYSANITSPTPDTIPLLEQSEIQKQERERAIQRKREREEKELMVAEKKAKAEA